jgi:hypothetical protein
MPTGLFQSYYPTYASDSLTIEWYAPSDTGCLEIASYTIQGSSDNSTWVALTEGTLGSITSNETYVGTA